MEKDCVEAVTALYAEILQREVDEDRITAYLPILLQGKLSSRAVDFVGHNLYRSAEYLELQRTPRPKPSSQANRVSHIAWVPGKYYSLGHKYDKYFDAIIREMLVNDNDYYLKDGTLEDRLQMAKAGVANDVERPTYLILNLLHLMVS